MTVLTPAALVKNTAGSPYMCIDYSLGNSPGYLCATTYYAVDQMGNPLPVNEIPQNENFTTSEIADYPGETWSTPPVLPCDAQPCTDTNAESFTDGEAFRSDTANPTPQAPMSPLANVKIFHFNGDFYFGSATTGSGSLVNSSIWQYYQDHVDHE